MLGKMPGPRLVCTDLGAPGDCRALLVSGMVLGSDKSPSLSLPPVQGLLGPWLSANVFIMCCLCDRLGSESRRSMPFVSLQTRFFSKSSLLSNQGGVSAWQGRR